MQLYSQANLKTYHTFGLDQTCQNLMLIENVDDLIAVYQQEEWKNIPKVMLGKGSNVLFTQPFSGLVMVNRLQGIIFGKDSSHHLIHVAGGEDWPALVESLTRSGIGGLENMAMIPGCCGSAPIQNIGAYGVEFSQVCDYVEYLCLESLTIKRMSNEECQFGYRDSVFKRSLYNKAVVVAIGLKLPIEWQSSTHYGPLQSLRPDATPEQIFERVCQIRRDKLPDPSLEGNAGSFFKNPIISRQHFLKLSEQFPDVVAYPSGQDIKIAAGWLIDQCGLKGYQIGGAQVHPRQALVLINKDKATAEDIVMLAAYVKQSVKSLYGIDLEHEVRFMNATHETTLNDLILEGNA